MAPAEKVAVIIGLAYGRVPVDAMPAVPVMKEKRVLHIQGLSIHSRCRSCIKNNAPETWRALFFTSTS